MRASVVLLLLVVCLFGQAPTDVFEKAPPSVDQALRARVAKFFEAHVSGKFRLAEEVVAEDSKDSFYNAEKRRYFSFEILSIQYSDNYTKATVVTQVEVDWQVPSVGKVRVKPPLKSHWRVDQGEWWYYVPVQKEWETPFGTMRPGPDAGSGQAPAPPGRRPTVSDVQAVLNQIEVAKTEVLLKSDEKSEDSIEIRNRMPGSITVRLDAPFMTGLSVTLDKETLQSGETARLRIAYAPPDLQPKTEKQLTLTFEPTGKVVPVRLTFTKPPALPKQSLIK
jgi:hypothetical protein